MKALLSSVMTTNAALFFFGAVQHAGIAIGSFSEPRIVPAALVETLCGLALAWGVIAIAMGAQSARRTAVITNLIALFGVLLGIASLSLGAGPRTASNDLYHGIMLILIAGALVLIWFGKPLTVRQG
jgi:hypothetical protein